MSSDPDQAEQRVDQKGRYAGLVEEGEQFMHLQQQVLLLGHRGEVAVEAIDHHHPAPLLLNRMKDPPGELPGRHLRRVDLGDLQQSIVDEPGQIDAHRVRPTEQGADALVELVHMATLAARTCRSDVLHGKRGLAGAGRPGEQGAGAPQEAAAHQGIEVRDAAQGRLVAELDVMIGGNQPGIDLDAAGTDIQIVVSGQENLSAQFLHLQASPGRAEVQGETLERNDPVADAVQMRIAIAAFAGQVVDEQHRGAARRKELLERQHLATVAQRILREQAKFRQAVEDHALRFEPLHLLLDQPDGFPELHFPGMKHGLASSLAEHFLDGG